MPRKWLASQALLDAFFTKDGEGPPRESIWPPTACAKNSSYSRTTCAASRIASSILRERRRGRVGARAQRRPVRRRQGDPCDLRADESRARRARFRRPDRPRARASDPVERRLGAAQARLRSRSPAARRSPGRLSAAMGHSDGAHCGILRGGRRARLEPHGVCGRRREAIDLRLSRRGARDAG